MIKIITTVDPDYKKCVSGNVILITKGASINYLNMKTIFNGIFLIACLVFTSISLEAQNSKCDPNTCTTKNSGKYNIELAGCNNYLDIYVLDTLGHAIKNELIKGEVEFFYLDETSLIMPFNQFFKTNSLRAKVPCPGFYNCRVNLFIGKDNCKVYFNNECDLRAQLK